MNDALLPDRLLNSIDEFVLAMAGMEASAMHRVQEGVAFLLITGGQPWCDAREVTIEALERRLAKDEAVMAQIRAADGA